MRGAVQFVIQKSRSPSKSQSIAAIARPSSRRSIHGDTSADSNGAVIENLHCRFHQGRSPDLLPGENFRRRRFTVTSENPCAKAFELPLRPLAELLEFPSALPSIEVHQTLVHSRFSDRDGERAEVCRLKLRPQMAQRNEGCTRQCSQPDKGSKKTERGRLNIHGVACRRHASP